MSRLFACLVLVGLASPAMACINDNELPTHEREFRSQYGELVSRPHSSSPRPLRHELVLGAGSGLLAGAFVLALVGRRARS